MSTPINNPSGTGFYGKGFWGRRVFWLNVPVEWRALDKDDYFQRLLNTWGDLGEEFIRQISLLPSQRDPYIVRTKNTETRWFYVHDSLQAKADDNVYNENCVRLIGEADYNHLPEFDPSGKKYEPLADVGRWWLTDIERVTFTVLNTRLRNIDLPSQYQSDVSLANEVWLTNGDLRLVFDFIVDRIWDRLYTNDTKQGVIVVGHTNGSTRPQIDLKWQGIPVVIKKRNYDLDVDKSTLRLRIPLESGDYMYVYDLPTSNGKGNLCTANSGVIDPSSVQGTLDYERGTVDLNITQQTAIGLYDYLPDIRAMYVADGYFLKLYAPPVIDYLAQDFGLDNDDNDPDAVQRSTLANISKFWGLKATSDSYRIRGEVSLFVVVARRVFYVRDDSIRLRLPESELIKIGDKYYSELVPYFIRFDHISADEKYYDNDTSSWLSITDHELIIKNDSRWNGMSVGMSYAVDVAQGYYGRISEFDSTLRTPVTVDSVTALSYDELLHYSVASGYKYRLRMRWCQYKSFNMPVDGNTQRQNPFLFGLTVYDYNTVPHLGQPPVWDDLVYQLDFQSEAWVADSGGSVPPADTDYGVWEVIIVFASGVVSPIVAGDNVAIRYTPKFNNIFCGYCPSHKMLMDINVTQETLDYYKNEEAVDLAIARLKDKLDTLRPIHARFLAWNISRMHVRDVNGVMDGQVAISYLQQEYYENAVSVEVSIYYRGLGNVGGTTNIDVSFFDGVSLNSAYSTIFNPSSDPDLSKVWQVVVERQPIDKSFYQYDFKNLHCYIKNSVVNNGILNFSDKGSIRFKFHVIMREDLKLWQ